MYKAGGNDRLCIDSYMGITLTSMVAKVLEFLLLDQSSWMRLCHTSISQHYRRGVSSTDTIYATQGVISRYFKGCITLTLTMYNLQKAFHSVVYPLLLEKLFEAGENKRRGGF